MQYQKFDTYILGLGFVRSKDDHCVYSKQVGNHFINIVLYVDDTLLIGNNKYVIKEVKSQLYSKFDMKYLDATNFILGMEITLLHFDPKSDGKIRRRMDFFF